MEMHDYQPVVTRSAMVAGTMAAAHAAAQHTGALVDNRPEAAVQRKQKEMLSTATRQLPVQFRSKASVSPKAITFDDNRPGIAAQRKLKEMLSTTTQQPPVQFKTNSTGLPGQLKSGIENLSGYSMDDVKVHYNSGAPAQLSAHAFAQGNQIHLASGQEKHLAHEAWHVVQQKQGRAKPTLQMKGKKVNDDDALEKEADVMGAKAQSNAASFTTRHVVQRVVFAASTSTVQRKIMLTGPFAPAPAPVTAPNTFSSLPPPGMAYTNSPVVASVYVNKEKKQTKPADLTNMPVWKNYNDPVNGKLHLLSDPSTKTGNTLIRMHAINGTFHGPSAASNMFLGTTLSNNQGPLSHLNEVERPIRAFLDNKAAKPVGAHYTVTPHYTGTPHYIWARAQNISDPIARANFLNWSKNGCPPTFTCDVDLYRQSLGGMGLEMSQQQAVISTLHGAPAAPIPAHVAAPQPGGFNAAAGGVGAAAGLAIGAGLAGGLGAAALAGGVVVGALGAALPSMYNAYVNDGGVRDILGAGKEGIVNAGSWLWRNLPGR